jgi:hypothetical protein
VWLTFVGGPAALAYWQAIDLKPAPPPAAGASAGPNVRDVVASALPECGKRLQRCEIAKKIRAGTGTSQYDALAVNVYNTDAGDRLRYVTDSVVLLLGEDMKVRWRSSDLSGYGIQSLDTDSLSHIYGQYAVTNHSGKAFVIAVTDTGVDDFGTIGGSLKFESYSEPQLETGTRALLSYREGWPANTLNPTTSVDVWVWDRSRYRYRGCAVGPPGEIDPAIASRKRCLAPIATYSVDLPGDRSATQPPP